MAANFEAFANALETTKFKEEFLKKRSVFLWGAVNDESAEDITNRLMYLESVEPGKEITFYLSSPGGSVTSGMVIYDTMKMISSPVSTVCIGLAASMGSILLSGGEKGKRRIFPSGRVMIHQPLIGQLYGQSSDIQIHAKELNRTKELLAKVLAENCGVGIERIMDDFERDYWMNSAESLDYGIVDHIQQKIEF